MNELAQTHSNLADAELQIDQLRAQLAAAKRDYMNAADALLQLSNTLEPHLHPSYAADRLRRLIAERDELKAFSTKASPIIESYEQQLAAATQAKEKAEAALFAITQCVPAMDGGSLYREHFDGDGNYVGSENIDPLTVIQQMHQIAQDASVDCGKGFLRAEELKPTVALLTSDDFIYRPHQYRETVAAELSRLQKLTEGK